jgi:hypothetical protein
MTTNHGAMAAIEVVIEAVHCDVLHERFLCFLFTSVSILIFWIISYYSFFTTVRIIIFWMTL